MATTRSIPWTQKGYGGAGRSVTYSLGSVDVGSAEADLFAAESAMACKRLGLTIKNGSDTDMTVKFFTTLEETPTAVHDSTEWDQEPDSSTSYTVGSASTSTSRKTVHLTGPFRWWKVRANHSAATSVGSVTVIATFLW